MLIIKTESVPVQHAAGTIISISKCQFVGASLSLCLDHLWYVAQIFKKRHFCRYYILERKYSGKRE